MKKKIIAVLLAVSLLVAGLFIVTTQVSAFGDYDGDSDYGIDIGDSDSDDSIFGFFIDIFVSIFLDIFLALFQESPIAAIFFLIVVGGFFTVIVLIIRKIKKKIRQKRGLPEGKAKRTAVWKNPAPAVSDAQLRPVREYLQLDPAFSESAFKEKLANLFVQYQNAVQEKDISSVRPYLTDAFYNTAERQIDSYRKYGRTRKTDRIAVLSVDISGFKQENGNDIMAALLRTRFVTYTVDDKSGEVVHGSKDAETFVDFEWKMLRASGKTTVSEGGVTVKNCPNCGAVINLNRTAKCAYCDSVVNVDAFDWQLDAISPITRTT